MKISITNHTGTRNRGCEALILSKIYGLNKFFDKPEIIVHSNDPLYDSYRLRGMSKVVYSYIINTPNHLRIRSLNRLSYGIAGILEKIVCGSIKGVLFNSISECKNSSLIMPSGGDIFTSDYGNMRKHLAYVEVGSHSKVYLCGHTVGKFNDKDKDYFLRAAENIDAISVREPSSYEYLKEIGVQCDVHLTADVAFCLPGIDKKLAYELLTCLFGVGETPYVGISVSQGIIKYSKLDENAYYNIFAEFCDYITAKGYTCLLLPHVQEKNPNNNDYIACRAVFDRTKNRRQVRIISGELSCIEYKGIIGLCDCLVGTRTHATIASLSQNIPTVSIAYSMKAHGIMRDVFGKSLASDLTIDAHGMTLDKLIRAFEVSLGHAPMPDRIKKIKDLSIKNFQIAKQVVGA